MEQTERETAEGKPRSEDEEEEEEEEMLHSTGLFIADCGGSVLEQVDILARSCGLCTGHAGAKEKREEESRRKKLLRTDCNPHALSPLHSLGHLDHG